MLQPHNSALEDLWVLNLLTLVQILNILAAPSEVLRAALSPSPGELVKLANSEALCPWWRSQNLHFNKLPR